MSLQTLPRPASPGAEDDESVEHLYCCDPNRALCGVDITDDEDLGDAETDGPECPLCEVLIDQPCGVPGCPDE
ncbi:hypothetical protein ACFVH6_21690 [Spirillospora sp. NPDC127200]